MLFKKFIFTVVFLFTAVATSALCCTHCEAPDDPILLGIGHEVQLPLNDVTFYSYDPYDPPEMSCKPTCTIALLSSDGWVGISMSVGGIQAPHPKILWKAVYWFDSGMEYLEGESREITGDPTNYDAFEAPPGAMYAEGEGRYICTFCDIMAFDMDSVVVAY